MSTATSGAESTTQPTSDAVLATRWRTVVDAIAHPRTSGQVTQKAVSFVAVLFVVSAVVVSWIYATALPNAPGVSPRGAALTSFLVFIAACAVGAVLGFILGLPRSRAVDDATQAVRARRGSDPVETAGDQGVAFTFNTNLIKVSDWLTTIIVGLTLVNLGKIAPAVDRMQQSLVEPLGGASYSGVYGICVVALGLVVGSICMYLYTSVSVREIWTRALHDATVIAAASSVSTGPDSPPARGGTKPLRPHSLHP